MKILGLSSATKIISIGLLDDRQVLLETTLSDIPSEKIMFYVKEAGVEPKEIGAVAVAAGPGSYSGLRGGVATAKTLAQTLNIPLVGVSTLEAIAYNLIDLEGTLAVVTDARADEYNFALFGAASGQLKRLTQDLVLKMDKIIEKLAQVQGVMYLAGNIAQIYEKILEKNPASQIRLADPLHNHPYGINVAKLGLEKIKSGETDDFLTLTPAYSHQPTFREFSP